ncbi:MAG: sigma-70 family RNA polymerase sigma factor [Planctomycetota bacterium]|nr:MAG: sigma-70 family RNA polymerase sigma factor [Planctomycetota bacterium]
MVHNSSTTDSGSNPGEDFEWIRRLAHSMLRDAHLAEDLAQETAMAALRRDSECGPVSRPWLRTVLVNRIRLQYRSDSRKLRRERNLAPDEKSGSDPMDHMVHEERVQAVNQALNRLKEQHRFVLQLRYWEGRSVSEIARMLELPVRTVESRLRRARAALQRQLDRQLGGQGRWLLVFAPYRWHSDPLSRPKQGAEPVPTSGRTLAAFGWAMSLGVAMILVSPWFPSKANAWSAGPAASPSIEAGQFEPAHPQETSLAPTSGSRRSFSENNVEPRGSKSPVVRIQALDQASEIPLAGVGLQVLHLKRASEDITAANGGEFHPQSGWKWQCLKRESLSTSEQGLLWLQPCAEAEAIRVESGAWTPTHSLGFRKRPEVLTAVRGKHGHWPALTIPMTRRTSSVFGRVVDGQGHPLPEAKILYRFGWSKNRSLRPDAVFSVKADGSFHLQHAAAEKVGFTLSVQVPGMQSLFDYRGKAGQENSGREVVFRMIPVREVELRIQDDGGHPMAGVTLTSAPELHWEAEKKQPFQYLPAWSSPVQTDSAGRAWVPVPVGGRANTCIYDPDGLMYRHTLPAKLRTTTLTLPQRNQFRGRLFNQHGETENRARITIWGQSGTWRTVSKMDGSFDFVPSPGVEELGILVECLDGRSDFFTWRSDLGFSPQFFMRPSGILSGWISNLPDERFDPKAMRCFPVLQKHLDPEATEAWVRPAQVEISEDGRFSITGLPPGEYLLRYGRTLGPIRQATAQVGDRGVALDFTP